MRLVREVLIHSTRVEVPHRGPAHDVHARGAEEAKVEGGIHLLHIAGLLSAGLEPGTAGHRAQNLLHDELAGEGQDDRVEGDKGDIPATLSILGEFIGVRHGELVGEEDEAVDWVVLGRVNCVERQKDEEDGERKDPGVLHAEVLCATQEGSGLATLREALRGCRGGLLEKSAHSISYGLDLVDGDGIPLWRR